MATLLKGMSVETALLELSHRTKRVAPVFHKLVMSAVANAKAQGLDAKNLRVLGVRVDKGVVLKRSRPRAQGRAFPIHKHTSHIVVTLTDAPIVSTKKPAKVVKVTGDAKAKLVATKPKKTITKKKVAGEAK